MVFAIRLAGGPAEGVGGGKPPPEEGSRHSDLRSTDFEDVSNENATFETKCRKVVQKSPLKEGLGSSEHALGAVGEPWEALGKLWGGFGRLWEALGRLWGCPPPVAEQKNNYMQKCWEYANSR